jgi:hypothetical protein
MRRAAAAVAALLALAVVCLTAVSVAAAAFVPASPRNYAHTHRPASAITLLVVHAIEGTAAGAISWFRNPRARVSANYVVSRDGAVTQMVPNWFVAWHAGNGYVNRHSIGIEHEGYVGVPAIFTDAEYRASAKLAATLLARYPISLDRRHVIGHSEVPDPNHPGRLGGFSHHTDPGRTWDWRRYMSYLSSYLAGVTPPPLAFDVTIPELRLGQTVRGLVHVEPVLAGVPAASVELRLDGRTVASSATPPFALDWDSTTARNGRRVLSVHAVATDGRTADAAVVVKLANPPAPPQILTQTLIEGQTVSGTVRWEVTAKGKVGIVEFLVDGLLVDAEFEPPWGFDWDTTQETPGPHTLTVRATNRDGTAATTATVHVAVANPAPEPAPAP